PRAAGSKKLPPRAQIGTSRAQSGALTRLVTFLKPLLVSALDHSVGANRQIGWLSGSEKSRAPPLRRLNPVMTPQVPDDPICRFVSGVRHNHWSPEDRRLVSSRVRGPDGARLVPPGSAWPRTRRPCACFAPCASRTDRNRGRPAPSSAPEPRRSS